MPPTRPVVRRVRLREHHQPKGNFHLFVEGKPIPRPRLLEIVKLPEADACHMIYVDRMDYELSESWHPSVDAAIYHARWEYGIEPDEWENLQVGGPPL
jgi:hypothetical protein